MEGNHKLQVINRGEVVITGVSDVLSFDSGEVLLETVQGTLMIRGEQLHVSRLTLDAGEIDVDGRVDSISYSDGSAKKTAGAVFSRLFK